jgi:hypothetical protein
MGGGVSINGLYFAGEELSSGIREESLSFTKQVLTKKPSQFRKRALNWREVSIHPTNEKAPKRRLVPLGALLLLLGTWSLAFLRCHQLLQDGRH